jgi:hypothetical protein
MSTLSAALPVPQGGWDIPSMPVVWAAARSQLPTIEASASALVCIRAENEWSNMDKLELVQLALRELGDVSAQDLSGFIQNRHAVNIDPKFIPLYKATIRDKLRLEAARQAARTAAEQAKADPAET